MHSDQNHPAGVHTSDCHIWAAINYLDSATDYRESLLAQIPNPGPEKRDLVMLDDPGCFRGPTVLGILFVIALATAVLLILAYLH